MSRTRNAHRVNQNESSERRIDHELDAIARFLDLAYLPQTANVIRQVDARTVADMRHGEFEALLETAVNTYLDEFPNGLNILGETDPVYRTQLAQAVDSLIMGAVSAEEEFSRFLLLQQSHAIAVSIGKSHGNTRELYKVCGITPFHEKARVYQFVSDVFDYG